MIEGLSPERILLLEDEPALTEVLGSYLRDEGFTVSEDFVGLGGVQRALTERSTLVILDLHLPKLHGSTVYRQLRAISDIPVIALASGIVEVDSLIALDLGADRVIGKPFSPREVIARVKSLLGAIEIAAHSLADDRLAIQYIGSIAIDRSAHEVRRRGAIISLTPTEYRILETLATHVNQVLSREQLIERTSRDGDIYDRTLDRHVGNLRQKIEDDPANPTSILTVHTVGYKLVGI